jgi:hypothetical protein
MRQKQRDRDEVALKSSLHEQLVRANGELPDHRTDHKCAESGLISEHRHGNAWNHPDDGKEDDRTRYKGGCFYVEDRASKKGHMPSCGHGSEYGCADICVIAGDEDI